MHHLPLRQPIVLIATLMLWAAAHAQATQDNSPQANNQTPQSIDVLLHDGYQAIDDSPYTALRHGQHALNMARQTQSLQHEADALKLMADSYLAMHQPDSAIGLFQRAINCYNLLNAPLHIAHSLMGIANGHLQLQTADQALQTLEQAQRLIDFEKLQREYSTDKLEKCTTRQAERILHARYHIFIMMFSLVALSIATIIILRRKNKKIKQLEAKNAKATAYTQQIEKQIVDEIKKREQQQQQLAQKSKLESLGNMAASIAHEINQPLGGISMGIDNIMIKLQEQNCAPDFLKPKVDSLFQNIDRIKNIIDHVRNFSRVQKPISLEQTNINNVVRNALSMLTVQFEKHGVELVAELDETIGIITADKYKLEQVMINLLSNAKHAVDEKAKSPMAPTNYRKKIEIKTENKNIDVIITVRDNGVGIPNKIRDKIFDPFFTTKDEGEGTGLGLSISYNFIKDILGNIKVDSREGEYTVFEITIPKI